MVPELVLAGRILRANLKRRSRPFKVMLIPTYRCNMPCTHCNIWKREPVEEMPVERIHRLFSGCSSLSWVQLSGGEIFLRPDLVEIAQAIIESVPELVLLDFPTNGYLTDRIVAWVGEIVGLNPRRLVVTVSLDGPRDVHDRMRGTQGSWRRSVETFRGLKGLGADRLQVFFGFTLSQYNAGMLERSIAEVGSLIPWIGHQDFHVNLAQVSSHYYVNPDFDPGSGPALEAELSRFWAEKPTGFHPVSILEHEYLRLARSYLLDGLTPLPCMAVTASCFIDPDGTIFPCAHYAKRLGNVADYGDDLDRLLSEPHVEELRREILSGKCPHCWTPCEAYQSIMGNLFRYRWSHR